jgi:hypothetical protein
MNTHRFRPAQTAAVLFSTSLAVCYVYGEANRYRPEQTVVHAEHARLAELPGFDYHRYRPGYNPWDPFFALYANDPYPWYYSRSFPNDASPIRMIDGSADAWSYFEKRYPRDGRSGGGSGGNDLAPSREPQAPSSAPHTALVSLRYPPDFPAGMPTPASHYLHHRSLELHNRRLIMGTSKSATIRVLPIGDAGNGGLPPAVWPFPAEPRRVILGGSKFVPVDVVR